MISSGFLYSVSSWSISFLSMAMGFHSPLPLAVYTVLFTPSFKTPFFPLAGSLLACEIYGHRSPKSNNIVQQKSWHLVVFLLPFLLLLLSKIRFFFTNSDSKLPSEPVHRRPSPRN